jgi:hypothetical protein
MPNIVQRMLPVMPCMTNHDMLDMYVLYVLYNDILILIYMYYSINEKRTW